MRIYVGVNVSFASKFYLPSRRDICQSITETTKRYVTHLLFPVTRDDGHDDEEDDDDDDDNNNNYSSTILTKQP
jgi:hypothetical protein